MRVQGIIGAVHTGECVESRPFSPAATAAFHFSGMRGAGDSDHLVGLAKSWSTSLGLLSGLTAHFDILGFLSFGVAFLSMLCYASAAFLDTNSPAVCFGVTVMCFRTCLD